MSTVKLTPEQIQEGYVDPLINILNFGLSQVDGETVDLVIAKLKESAAKLDSNSSVDLEGLCESVLKIAETSVSLTPTKKDDKAVAAIGSVINLLFGKVGLLKGLINIGKEVKGAKNTVIKKSR